jgi:alpha-glucosidase (family GH31 glycosyl hydrolase)
MILGEDGVNMGLGGIAFAGYDVGGCRRRKPRLFARWVSLGFPHFQRHSMVTQDTEPRRMEEVERFPEIYQIQISATSLHLFIVHDASRPVPFSVRWP